METSSLNLIKGSHSGLDREWRRVGTSFPSQACLAEVEIGRVPRSVGTQHSPLALWTKVFIKSKKAVSLDLTRCAKVQDGFLREV